MDWVGADVPGKIDRLVNRLTKKQTFKEQEKQIYDLVNALTLF